MSRYTNHLIHETSPYLLQHAHNPVDWYPWGAEAFEKAKKEDKPILLSIGYSACHWCHVMEEESFEDEQTAQIMNELFVNIKVDREERPDVDHRYMKFVQIITGSGGWPLTVFLTPDGEPFYGGTYFPPQDRYGKPGFKKLLKTVADFYHHNKTQLNENLDQIRQALKRAQRKIDGQSIPDENEWQKAVQKLTQYYDPVHGGMGKAPKFPAVQVFSLLLRQYARSADDHYLNMVEHTLQRMAEGGIYDQLGGGFARYSVDEKWLVPHFEKMLYDNAQLITLYVDAYQATHQPFYLNIAEQSAQFVLRELTDARGGFYSSLDADSEGEEGKFYIWSKAEILKVLGQERGELFCARFGVTDQGNFEGKNILFVHKSFKQLALEFNKSEREVETIIEQARKKLFERRDKRTHPGLDFKVQTSWNGLMLSALSRLYQVTARPDYARAIRRNIDFLKERQYEDGQLKHVYSKGQSKINGFLDDYAYLTQGLIDAYEALFEEQYLRWARELTEEANRRFADEQDGGYFFNQSAAPGQSTEQLNNERYKEESDASLPSAVAIMIANQLRLYAFFEQDEFLQRAESLLRKYGNQAIQQPYAYASYLNALDFYLQQPTEIVLLKSDETNFETLRQHIFLIYLPNKVLLVNDPASKKEPIGRALLRGRSLVEGQSTIYVCRGQSCSLPVTTPEQLDRVLKER